MPKTKKPPRKSDHVAPTPELAEYQTLRMKESFWSWWKAGGNGHHVAQDFYSAMKNSFGTTTEEKDNQ
jgi:hypothetical protein